jgi:hypothetical protein
MLREVCAGCGNLLLNIGPKPDGSVPKEAIERLTRVGKWMKNNHRAVYGSMDRTEPFEWMNTGRWTRQGDTMHFWCSRWPGRELAIGGLRTNLKSVRLLPDGKKLPFTQDLDRLVIRGLPEKNPDKFVSTAVFEMKFDGRPMQFLNAGYEPVGGECVIGKWFSDHLPRWQVSKLIKRSSRQATLNDLRPVRLKDSLGWQPVEQSLFPGFVNVHACHGARDGFVYIANRIAVEKPGRWTLHFGRDAGIKVWLDGREILCDPLMAGSVGNNRSRVEVDLSAGEHELLVALDTHQGAGWGMMMCFGVPPNLRKGTPIFPKVVE